MRKRFVGVAAVGSVALLGLAACGSSDSSATSTATGGAGASSGSSGGVQVGVILPDTQSSARWESFDKPYLQQAFDAAGIKADIQNALGDKSKFATIGDAMIQEGVKVLITVNLDPASGAQVQQKAKNAGIKSIDYDRLTPGGAADVYVSFDNVKVGELQGAGLIQCLGSKADAKIIEINGSPTDNNATLFKQGYDSQLDPKYKSGWTKVDDKSIADWKNDVAGTTFEQSLTAAGNKVDGVLVANDGMAQSVIQVLKKNGLNGKVPVTGQDATPDGLRSVLVGDQCMTVYKAVKAEAKGAADAAIAIIKGTAPQTTGTTTDPQTKRAVPSVLLTPVAITADKVKDVVADGFVKASEICTTDAAKAACTKNGVQ
ncbi:MAG TPA: substrate-binding domain-containing protein [Kineosporiaceae bacterium]|jgi:D-xylose transport system substrate-binding protein|nr:substrate-binding domain-containing protein [Kineosporiaceae bacterium]